MNKSTFNLGKVFIAIFIITILSTACNSKLPPAPVPSQTPIPTTIAQVSPTSTKISPTITPVPPTSTPTSIPVLQPNDYLLTVDELPIELFKSYMVVFLKPDGSISYNITFFNAVVGVMRNSITVAAQPYLEVPDKAMLANWLIEDPMLGENSLASNDGDFTYTFFKGNALVSLNGSLTSMGLEKRGELTLEEMVNLGKVIEARLPNMLSFSPITFPEQLDQAADNQYLKTLTLSKRIWGSDELIPSNTFSGSDNICLSMKMVDPPQPFAFAIYDVQEKVYVQKFVPEFGQSCTDLIGASHAGQYEMRLAIRDTLVAILPFDIQ